MIGIFLALLLIIVAAKLIFSGIYEMYITDSSSGGFNIFIGFFILMFVIGACL